MKKTIITVVGKDTVGIIAKVCTYLANNRINILDISQTIVSGYFNMMMIVDANDSTKPFGDFSRELEHSDLNLNAFEDLLAADKLFALENMLKIC